MKDLLKQWGKHVVALILFLGLVMTYFSPAVFDGKVIMQAIISSDRNGIKPDGSIRRDGTAG